VPRARIYDLVSVCELPYGPAASSLHHQRPDRWQHAPDIVGNIPIDQAWGLFQISGAAHEVSGSYNILNTVGAPAGAVGIAAGAPTALSEILRSVRRELRRWRHQERDLHQRRFALDTEGIIWRIIAAAPPWRGRRSEIIATARPVVCKIGRASGA
jgi:hypothetical protein